MDQFIIMFISISQNCSQFILTWCPWWRHIGMCKIQKNLDCSCILEVMTDFMKKIFSKFVMPLKLHCELKGMTGKWINYGYDTGKRMPGQSVWACGSLLVLFKSLCWTWFIERGIWMDRWATQTTCNQSVWTLSVRPPDCSLIVRNGSCSIPG